MNRNEYEEVKEKEEHRQSSKVADFIGGTASFLTMTGIMAAVVLVPVFFIKSCGDQYRSSLNEEKKLMFEKNKEFVCQQGFQNDKYLVSKDSGWVVSEEYFKKGDILTDIAYCEKKE